MAMQNPAETMVNFGGYNKPKMGRGNPRASHRQPDSNSDKSHSQSRSPEHVNDNASDDSNTTMPFFTYNNTLKPKPKNWQKP